MYIKLKTTKRKQTLAVSKQLEVTELPYGYAVVDEDGEWQLTLLLSTQQSKCTHVTVALSEVDSDTTVETALYPTDEKLDSKVNQLIRQVSNIAGWPTPINAA